MRVAIVHSYYSSRQPSGENVVVDAQASALQDHGLDVRVIAARTDELESRRGYRVRAAVSVATGGGLSPIEELKKFRPDVVHVHNLFPNWGTQWLHEWRGPLVATVHNFRPVCAAGTLFRDGKTCTLCPDAGSMSAVTHACYRGSRSATIPLAARTRRGVAGDALLSRADRVVLLSPRVRELYVSFGLPAERIEVIPNFVDGAGFNPGLAPGLEWAYIGRLTEEKGVLGLTANWPEGAVLNIFGDGPLRLAIEAAAAENPGVFYHGPISRDDVPTVLGRARGLVFPSEWPEGGIAQSYVEALAAGRTVVARAGSSVGDDLQAENFGSTYDKWCGFAGALAKASASAQGDGLIARSHYESTFTRGTFLSRSFDMYEALLSTRAGGARSVEL